MKYLIYTADVLRWFTLMPLLPVALLSLALFWLEERFRFPMWCVKCLDTLASTLLFWYSQEPVFSQMYQGTYRRTGAYLNKNGGG